jgi:hypothetical protein
LQFRFRERLTLAIDSAVKTYGEGAAAHRVAYAALKHQYEKKGDNSGRQSGPNGEEADYRKRRAK